MEKVVKKTFGYFNPKENEDYTHVIFTESEYNKKEQKIRDLEENIRKLEREYKARNEDYKRSADAKIAEIRAQAERRVNEAQNEMNTHKNRADSFENMNRNLIRVATERANAKRGLTKKQHSGYLFLNAEDWIYSCECQHPTKTSRTVVIKLPCFKVRLQSPYDTAIEIAAARDMIYNDIIKQLGGKMGINTTYEDEFISYDENEVRKIWDGEETFMFRLFCKANFLKNLWEFKFFSRDMPIIPNDMIVKPIPRPSAKVEQ